MAFVFVSILLVYFGELTVILRSGVFTKVCVTVLRPVAGQFPVPLGQQFTVAINFYACVFTCACSFTVIVLLPPLLTPYCYY